MPLTLYTHEEYTALLTEVESLRKRVQAMADRRPVESIDASVTRTALSQVWSVLGVKDQTQCMMRLSQVMRSRGVEGLHVHTRSTLLSAASGWYWFRSMEGDDPEVVKVLRGRATPLAGGAEVERVVLIFGDGREIRHYEGSAEWPDALGLSAVLMGPIPVPGTLRI